jgi:hypothetical protein
MNIPYAFTIPYAIAEKNGYTDLWNETVARRYLHHMNSNNYNNHKKSLVYKVKEILNKEQINNLQQIQFGDISTLSNNPFIPTIFGGNYSERSTLYYDNLSPEQQCHLTQLFDTIKPTIEETIGSSVCLNESNFKVCVLRYEGKSAKFAWHYDTEEPNCLRILIMFKCGGTVPPFTYIDNTNGKKEIDIHTELGDCIILRGTTTYHCVKETTDPQTIRHMLGFQIRIGEQMYHKSFCSEFRSQTFTHFLTTVALPQTIKHILITQISKFLLSAIGIQPNIKLEMISSLSIIIASYMLSGKMPDGIGTNVANSIESISLLYIGFLCCTLDPMIALNNTAYILGTELLFQPQYK